MSQGKKAIACKKLIQWARLRQEGHKVPEKAAANGFSYGVRQQDSNLRIPALIWCMENTKSEYTFIPSIIRESDHMGTRFFFRDELDACAFRLVWG
ncbi:MAG: hypothetical protein EOP84_02905 [Verrucomicrobiaceae bacterium]|nr:MAG: hypothetical protein EOP84_02905 [Verrucomicrobiaceae bacterium]